MVHTFKYIVLIFNIVLADSLRLKNERKRNDSLYYYIMINKKLSAI